MAAEEDSARDAKKGRDLLWDCFVNWSFTLERMETRETDTPDG
ncbi:MAG: hypothetical protein ABSB56_04215 [Nitrososphaerales archaeon]|jgi:hypothetical protein